MEEIKIRAEQKNLGVEKHELTQLLDSDRLLTNLVKTELESLAQEFGDERRSPLKVRGEAQAFSERDLLSVDPITVVLSKHGWIRSAKGHDLDPKSLSYKAGDTFLSSAKGRSNQTVFFLDSTGRFYALASHTLPSARGQGEPITGRLNPPSGVHFCDVIIGTDSQYILLGSDAGYGFVTSLKALNTKNRSGKAVISIPAGGKILGIKLISDKTSLIAAVSSTGRLLLFPVGELPFLAKGRGNKIINIPASRVVNREEYVVDYAIVRQGSSLFVHSGKRYLHMKNKDLTNYIGERGRRGHKLPRGFQNVDRLQTDDP